MNHEVLVLTRDEVLLEQLGRALQGDYRIIPCDSLATLHQRSRQSTHRAVLVDLCRPSLDGPSAGRFMAELVEAVHGTPLYALADQNCPPRLRRLADKSADLCLTMPAGVDQLKAELDRQLELPAELESFVRDFPHKELRGRKHSMATFTPEMFQIIDDLKVATRHDVTVLLVGETGSGKTYLAQLIHEMSARADARFCTVACGALPPDLIESELFGYVKGAFTGADADKEGKFAATGRGTLLLDEIDVLPLRETDPAMMEALLAYCWPGNIRELKNVIHRAVLYAQRGVLSVRDLPKAVRESAGRHRPPAVNGTTLDARVEMLERRIIEDALRRNNQRRKNTAAELGINRVTLYNKMRKFGLLD